MYQNLHTHGKGIFYRKGKGHSKDGAKQALKQIAKKEGPVLWGNKANT